MNIFPRFKYANICLNRLKDNVLLPMKFKEQAIKELEDALKKIKGD